MWLHPFICFYCLAVLRQGNLMGGSKPSQVIWPFVQASPDNVQSWNALNEQMVRLQIDSPVFLYEDVRLECTFQLNNKQLYSIKWYKDEHEFFQYVPHEKPQVRTFASRGIRLEIPAYTIANGTFCLWLHSVHLDTQGTYRCEISTDAPDFITLKDSKVLEVYGECGNGYFLSVANLGFSFLSVLPNKGPRITGSRLSTAFSLKNRVDLNCTSAKSKPVTTLQWFINDKLAPSDYLIEYRQVNHSDGLQTKALRLKFTVNEEHLRKYGNMNFICVATYKSFALDNNETSIRRHSKWNPKAVSPEPKGKPIARPADNNASHEHLTSWVLLSVGGFLLLHLAYFGEPLSVDACWLA